MPSAAFESLVEAILQRCPMIRSIWLSGLPAGASVAAAPGALLELIAFGDELVLRGLRNAVAMHSKSVQLLVVTDGDAFQSAWGEHSAGSLSRLGWCQATSEIAYYTASSRSASASAVPLRTRRRAVRVWHGASA